MRLLSAAVGPEVSLGVIMFLAGTVVCVWNYVLLERQARGQMERERTPSYGRSE